MVIAMVFLFLNIIVELLVQVVTVILVIFVLYVVNLFLIMTNKDFIKSMEFQFYNLNTVKPFSLYFGRCDGVTCDCKVYLHGVVLFNLVLTICKRKLSAEIFYHNLLDCKHSPYELQNWCVNTFRGASNYFNFISGLETDLDFVVKSHPGLFCPF